MHKLFSLFVILVAGSIVSLAIFVIEKKLRKPPGPEKRDESIILVRRKLWELGSILSYSNTDPELTRLFDSLESYVNNHEP